VASSCSGRFNLFGIHSTGLAGPSFQERCSVVSTVLGIWAHSKQSMTPI